MAVDIYLWAKSFYGVGVTLVQMKKLVEKGKLTEAQYKEITGYVYPNPQ